MSPTDLLAGAVLLTAAAAVVDRFLRRQRQAALKALAAGHGMHYSVRDPLRLTPRVAGRLPVAGAAGVRVLDLMYKTDESAHHYVFTVEYTTGTDGQKRRVRRVGSCQEPRRPSDGWRPKVSLTEDGPPVMAQYRLALGESE